MNKIYLAGPEVFLQNALEVGKTKKELCKKYGFEGLFPLDNEVDFSKGKRYASKTIFEANENMINSCDIIIANLTPFRGPSADVGTVYEMGYANGLGKSIFGYSNKLGNLLENTIHHIGGWNDDNDDYIENYTGQKRDFDDYIIEDFDNADNLMIVESLLSQKHPLIQIDANGDIADLRGFEQILNKLKDK